MYKISQKKPEGRLFSINTAKQQGLNITAETDEECNILVRAYEFKNKEHVLKGEWVISGDDRKELQDLLTNLL